MENSQDRPHKSRIAPQIILRPEVEIEIREAFQYYLDIEKQLGMEFIKFLDEAINSITRNPLSYQKAYKETRRILLRKFPYAVFYIAEAHEISIVACFHQRRSEIDWLKRS